MPKRVQVIVQTEPDSPHDWRWFVASLCFIQFYCQSVTSGTNLWLMWSPPLSGPWGEETFFWFTGYALDFAGAIAFLGLGRCLWQRRSTIAYWLIRVVGLSLASLVVSLVRILIEGHSTSWWADTHPPPVYLFGANIVVPVFHGLILDSIGTHVPWILLAMTALRLRWFGDRKSRWRIHPSILLASGWVAGQVVQEFLLGYHWKLLWTRGSQVNALLASAPEVCIVLGLCATVGLYGRCWQAIIFTGGFVLCEVFSIGCRLHMCYLAFGTGPLGHLAILNLNMFFVGCVHSVKMIGPWVLITVLVWKELLRGLPDDGSPLPRSFCGRCRYNLHGLDHPERCPECGSMLDWPKLKAPASASKASDSPASSGVHLVSVDPERTPS